MPTLTVKEYKSYRVPPIPRNTSSYQTLLLAILESQLWSFGADHRYVDGTEELAAEIEVVMPRYI